MSIINSRLKNLDFVFESSEPFIEAVWPDRIVSLAPSATNGLGFVFLDPSRPFQPDIAESAGSDPETAGSDVIETLLWFTGAVG